MPLWGASLGPPPQEDAGAESSSAGQAVGAAAAYSLRVAAAPALIEEPPRDGPWHRPDLENYLTAKSINDWLEENRETERVPPQGPIQRERTRRQTVSANRRSSSVCRRYSAPSRLEPDLAETQMLLQPQASEEVIDLLGNDRGTKVAAMAALAAATAVAQCDAEAVTRPPSDLADFISPEATADISALVSPSGSGSGPMRMVLEGISG